MVGQRFLPFETGPRAVTEMPGMTLRLGRRDGAQGQGKVGIDGWARWD
jgi:hypothetical protein